MSTWMTFFINLRSKIQDHHLDNLAAWRDRLLVWLAAVVAGLSVVGFTLLSDFAITTFAHWRTEFVWLPFVLMPVGGMMIVWLTRRFFAGTAGSGIPQVMAALDTTVPSQQMGLFVSLKLSIGKALLGALALLCGFSLGREGPSVQIAAGVMYSVRGWLSERTRVRSLDLILVGGAAGIAAAFNAPLAGIMFAMEELSRKFEQRSSGLIITAIVLSGVVAISILGNFTYFGRINVTHLETSLILPGILCALVAGVLGGIFAKLLIASSRGTNDWFSRMRLRYPVYFAAACGLSIALLGWLSHGAAHGSGYQYTHDVLAGDETLPLFYVAVKFIATWLSYWSGAPGGIFAPSLAIGAGIGNDVAVLLQYSNVTPLIALGMVGFMAAVSQAPITSFIIVMEMIDGHTMVLSLMATALLSAMISRLLSPPLYYTLASLQLDRLTSRS